jgi:hypothetical protein
MDARKITGFYKALVVHFLLSMDALRQLKDLLQHYERRRGLCPKRPTASVMTRCGIR